MRSKYQTAGFKKIIGIFILISIYLIIFSCLPAFADASFTNNRTYELKEKECYLPIQNLKPLRYKNFTNIWVLDESGNPTGTHKDRFAQAVINLYRTRTRSDDKYIPPASIISAGSAAIAIQTCLSKHSLPNLKVLTDLHTCDSVIDQMTKLGCEVYKTDLEAGWLSSQDILRLTNNSHGFDLTFEGTSPILSSCYSDLVRATINQQPDYIFVPYGSGLLYHNFKAIKTDEHRGNAPCLLGATVMNPVSKATKLYSPYKSWPIAIKNLNDKSSIASGVYNIQESSITCAEKILKDNGYKAEPSGAAGLALMLEIENSLPKDKKIIIVSTGLVKTSN